MQYGARCDPRVTEVVLQGAFTRFRLRLLDRIILTATRATPAGLGARYFGWRVARESPSKGLCWAVWLRLPGGRLRHFVGP